MGKIRITAVIVSTRPMEVYGGIRLSENAVRELGEKVRRGEIPFGLHHDPRLGLDAEIIDVATRRNDQGEVFVEATIEVDEGEYMKNGGESVAGFSISGTTPLLKTGEIDPVAIISADAYWFDDSQLNAAYKVFNDKGISVQANRLYEFSDASGAVVILGFAGQQIATMPTNLICSYIYDSLKHMFSRKGRGGSGPEPSDFAIRFDPETGRMVDLHIKTSSQDVLKDALDKLPKIIESNVVGTYEYLADDRSWNRMK